MNLDSYINLLNTNMEATAEAECWDEKAIHTAIRGKANNLATKVSRAILWEAGGLIVMLAGGAIALFFQYHPLIRLIAIFAWAICIVMGLAYAWKYRQIKHLVNFEGDTLRLLYGLIRAVKQLIKLYIWMIVISIIVGFVLGGVYGFMEQIEASQDMPAWLTAWYATPVSLITIILVVWGSKWYINMLYGKPLRALELCAAELESI